MRCETLLGRHLRFRHCVLSPPVERAGDRCTHVTGQRRYGERHLGVFIRRNPRERLVERRCALGTELAEMGQNRSAFRILCAHGQDVLLVGRA